LENIKKIVAEFEKKINTKVRRYVKLDIAEKRDFRKRELPGEYIVKILYR